jgi:hypothetical protein
MNTTLLLSTLLVVVAIIIVGTIAVKSAKESFEVAKEFEAVTGQPPKPDELTRFSDITASGAADAKDVRAMMERGMPAKTLEEKMKVASGVFDSAIRDAAKDPSPAHKQALSSAYNGLLCIAAEFDSLKQFYSFLQGTYKEMLPVLYDSLNKYPTDKACVKFHPDNLAYQELGKGNFTNKRLMSSFLSGQKCDETASAGTVAVLGVAGYKRADDWAAKNCGDYGKCGMKLEAMTDAPQLSTMMSDPPTKDSGATADVHYVLNQPSIVYNFYGVNGPSTGMQRHVTPQELEEKVVQQCKLDASRRMPNVNEVKRGREMEDIKTRCEMSSKYTNADNFGKLFPEYEWMVPQPRAPVCATSAPCTVNAQVSQSALIGTLLSDAGQTQVGSIMPRFVYEEQPDAPKAPPPKAAPATSPVKKEEAPKKT